MKNTNNAGSTAILLPSKKILVMGGKLHPTTTVSMSCNVFGDLVSPTIEFDTTGRECGALTLAFSQLPLAALRCKLDFVDHILPTFGGDVLDIDRGDHMKTILALHALCEKFRQLQLHLVWDKVGNSEWQATGLCEIWFEWRPRSLTSTCRVDKGEDSLSLASFFSELPKVRAYHPRNSSSVKKTASV